MNKVIGFLFTILLIGCIVIPGCVSPVQTQPTTPSSPSPATTPPAGVIKIGHIRPLTGNLAIDGDRMVKAANLAFDQAGFQVAGKKIEIIVEDDAGLAEVSIDKARKLVEQDKVAIVLGPTSGGCEMAVSAYMNKMGIPNMHTNPSPLGIIMEKHQWTIQAGGAEPQLPSSVSRYAFEQLGVKSVIIAAPDNAPGHGFMNAFMGNFKKLGGQVIQEQYAPMNTNDFAPYLATMKDADACVAWFDGAMAVKFLSQYEEFGVGKRMPIIAAHHGSFFAPFVVNKLPPKAAQVIMGRVCPTPYSSLLEFPISKQFVQAYKGKYGYTPDGAESGPYQGSLLILAALKATNGDTTPAKLRQAILDLQIEGPEGPIRFDKEKMSSIKNVYICKVDKIGDEYVLSPVYTYKDVPPLGF